jgi:hypothetical protein
MPVERFAEHADQRQRRLQFMRTFETKSDFSLERRLVAAARTVRRSRES